MKASLIASIIIASLFFQIQYVLSQIQLKPDPEQLYVKGSYNYSYRNSTGYIKTGLSSRSRSPVNGGSWEQIFGGSIGYQYSKTLQFEFNFSLAKELSLSDSFIREQHYDTVYHSYRFSKYRSSELTLRANIFPNPDRRDIRFILSGD